MGKIKKQLFNLSLILLALFLRINLFARLTPTEAGYLNAVTDFGADNSGASVTTASLQNAINAATSQHKPLFIPAGTYLVDGTLVVEDDAGGERSAQNTFITGSGIDPANRTVILLKSGTFPNANRKGRVILHKGFGNEKYPDTFNRILQSIDIKIQDNNAGAIALRWRGAEGCFLCDLKIDVTGGFAGIDMLPGSGGSAAGISITGGEYGIYLPGDATQPTPTITDLTLRGQTSAAINSNSTRGSLTITGAHFFMTNGVPAFKLSRHTDFTWSPGGNPILTDCVIEYAAPDEANIVMGMANNNEQSLHFSDVYVKNAAVLLDEDVTVKSNSDGWRYYKIFAYNSGWDKASNGDEPIYIEGVKQAGKVYEDYIDDLMPPANIRSKHSLGETFPSFESPGAVNVKSFAHSVENGDWAPAFNAAIDAGEVVFVPPGDYIIYNTIRLKSNTALIGCGHKNSRILGRDDRGRRFGNCTNAWTAPKPMVQTPDDKMANCILADIGIHVNGPFNSESHSPEPLACYAILWRAGNHSIIKNIDYMRENRNNYRSAWVLKDKLTNSNWLHLRSLPSPTTIDGIKFASECAYAYHTFPEIPSRILVETVQSNKRIMTRSLPPVMFNACSNAFDIPNMTITKNAGGSFDIATLKITNAAWVPDEGTDVQIKGEGGNGTTKIIALKGVSRENLQSVDLNWTGVTKLIITSAVPFSLDDLVIDGTTINFENVTGNTLAENVDWSHQCSGYGYYHLPMFYMASPYVIIEGGCKYYNHWKHGSTWLRITEPYVLVKNNDPDDIVSFYHAHAQHSQNFYKFKIVNAHNVSLFGVKTENALEFTRVENSDNIRLMGHGGMTNPPRGTAHYRIENSTNYQVVSPTDEVVTSDDCINCGMGDAMLPRTAFGTYDDIQEVYGGQTITPHQSDSPILYLRGKPGDPWGPAGTPVAIKFENPGNPSLPQKFTLHQNYPNPFNPATEIKYEIPAESHVKLTVYDSLGRVVRTLVNEKQSAGKYVVNFSAKIPSGVYFYEIRANEFTAIKKMNVLK